MDINLRIQEATGEIGEFDRLPEDIISLILTLTRDLQFLCQSLLVSKRFARSIYSIRAVSISVPAINAKTWQERANLSKLFSQISENFTPLYLNNKMKFFRSLINFKELRSVNLEVICPRRECDPSHFNWKAQPKTSGPMLGPLVLVMPAERSRKDLMMWPLKCCREWMLMACFLVRTHNMLKSVVITDSHRHGKLVLRGEELVGFRKRFISYDNLSVRSLKKGWISDLHLPVSGNVMKWVLVMIMNFAPDPFTDADFDDILSLEYDEEERAFAEMVREILMKHRNKIHTCNV